MSFRGFVDEILNGKYSEAVRYLIFGALNVVITWVSYSLLVVLGTDLNVSNILSWIIGVLVAFVCNKFWVFRSKSTEGKTLGREFVSFIGGRIFTGIVAFVGFPILYALGLDQSFMGVDGLPAKILTSVIEIALNFVISKYLVFLKPKTE